MAKRININAALKKQGLRLNAQQLEAVKFLDGTSVIIAGAGTGKTATIVSKVNYAYLEDPCTSVLCITFTKKAVAELESRIVGNMNCTASTFHSFFYRILRANGYKSFKFIDNDAQKRGIIKSVLEEEGMTDKLTAGDIEDALRKGDFADENTRKALESYWDVLKQRRLLDFDSLQYFCRELLQTNPAVAIRTRKFYDHVMIDEAQDISKVQADIIKLIWEADANPSITFVGDPNQSIYGFRGSAANVMSNLQQHYAAIEFRLSVNYRSTESILEIANAVLPTSSKLSATRGKGEPVIFYAGDSQKDEAKYVAENIRFLHNSGTPLKDIAILFRASHAVKEIYEVLVSERIPFVQVGSDPFKWNNSRYKCFLAIFSFLYDHNNSHYKCALPLLGLPNDIASDMDEAADQAFSQSLLGIASLSKKHRERLQEFFAIDPEGYELKELASLVWAKYLKAYFKAEDDEILENFLDEISAFSSFIQLRNHILEVRRQAKQMKRLAENPNADYVRLMSIHSSKGIEFPVVFLAGAADGFLPDTSHEEISVHEENRLAYVAVTRAKDRLFISYPKSTSKGSSAMQSSRFFEAFFGE